MPLPTVEVGFTGAGYERGSDSGVGVAGFCNDLTEFDSIVWWETCVWKDEPSFFLALKEIRIDVDGRNEKWIPL